MAGTKNVPGSGYGNVFLDTLILGGRVWDQSTTINVFFGAPANYDSQEWVPSRTDATGTPDAGSITGGNVDTLKAWEPAEAKAFVYALSLFQSVCGLKFSFNSTLQDADIAWWKVNIGTGVDAFHETRAAQDTQQVWGYFNPSSYGWWLAQQFGGYSLSALIREIGHGLGLADAHTGGGQPGEETIFPGIAWGETASSGTFGYNRAVYSVMSPLSGAPVANAGTDYGNQGGLGAFDIAALQALYGANNSTGAGNNVYKLLEWNDLLTGYDTVESIVPGYLDGAGKGSGWRCIWDAGGNDTFDASSTYAGVDIDLRPASLVAGDPGAGGYLSYVAGVAAGFTIANGVTIENAIGGRGVDTLTGNAAANRLIGNGGGDRLYGGGGTDTLSGGAGVDWLYGGSGSDKFVFNSTLSSTSNKDYIKDWSAKYDTIQLENAFFKALKKTGTLSKGFFVVGSKALQSDDRIGYNKTTGDLWYDSNGSASGGKVVFANIGKYKAIAYNDFIVI